MLILFYADDIIKANPCLQNGPRQQENSGGTNSWLRNEMRDGPVKH